MQQGKILITSYDVILPFSRCSMQLHNFKLKLSDVQFLYQKIRARKLFIIARMLNFIQAKKKCCDNF